MQDFPFTIRGKCDESADQTSEYGKPGCRLSAL